MVSRSRNSIVGKDLVWFIVLEDVNGLGWNSVLLHHEVLKVKNQCNCRDDIAQLSGGTSFCLGSP